MPKVPGRASTSVTDARENTCENTRENTYVLATANPGKAREIEAILGASCPELTLVLRPTDVPDVVEDGKTLVANARLKAKALCRATGLPAIADDTGLFVEALGGAPGVDAAVFSGPHANADENCRKLLHELERVGAVSPQSRKARFTTVAFVAWPGGDETWCEGCADGVIIDENRGDGFGYDPLFAPLDGDGRTFGELALTEKNALSHRSRAFVALATALQARR